MLHALTVLFAATLAAQDPARDEPREPFTVPAGELALTTLIDRAAAYLECNVLWMQQEMASAVGQPTLRLQAPLSLDRDGCLELLADSLYRHGFALTWANENLRMMEAIAMHGPRGRDVVARAVVRTPEQVLAHPSLRMPVSVTVPLQHVNAVVATNSLRPFFASTGAAGSTSLTLGNVGNASAMLLSGMQDQVAQAIRHLRTVDVAPPPEHAPPGTAERLAALEQRLAALEAKVAQLPPATGK